MCAFITCQLFGVNLIETRACGYRTKKHVASLHVAMLPQKGWISLCAREPNNPIAFYWECSLEMGGAGGLAGLLHSVRPLTHRKSIWALSGKGGKPHTKVSRRIETRRRRRRWDWLCARIVGCFSVHELLPSSSFSSQQEWLTPCAVSAVLRRHVRMFCVLMFNDPLVVARRPIRSSYGAGAIAYTCAGAFAALARKYTHTHTIIHMHFRAPYTHTQRIALDKCPRISEVVCACAAAAA